MLLEALETGNTTREATTLADAERSRTRRAGCGFGMSFFLNWLRDEVFFRTGFGMRCIGGGGCYV